MIVSGSYAMKTTPYVDLMISRNSLGRLQESHRGTSCPTQIVT